MRPCSVHSRQLACSCRPSSSCRRHSRGLKPILCGSKSRRKQSEGRDSPGEGLREQESAASGTPVEEQSSSSPRLSRSGKPIGWKVLPREDPIPVTDIQEEQTDDYELGPAPRGRVFEACATTSAILCALALALRARAPVMSPAALHTNPAEVERLLQWPQEVNAMHAAVAISCAALVTAARALLLQRWPAFAEASQRSNSLVMPRLSALDLAWLAALPGISEELLFRGALIPSLYPDWRGVVVSGVGFGLLHKSGRRNLAFAGWASLVGMLYGAAFVYTGDILVPIVSHSLANLGAGLMWRQSQEV